MKRNQQSNLVDSVAPAVDMARQWSGARASAAVKNLTSNSVTLWLPVLLGVLYSAMVCWHGVPALRHDWAWPRGRDGFIDLIVNSASGWGRAGLGGPIAYPGGYIVGVSLGLVGTEFGPFATLVLFSFSIGLTITLGARAVARSLESASVQIAAVEIFSLFNPWVYNETVAGHLYMLLAYGASALLVGAILSGTKQKRRMAVVFVLILPQIQFFIIAYIVAAIQAVVKKNIAPWLTATALSLPIWFGVLLDRTSLLKIPYTLSWEMEQSVPPIKAVLLQGYFAHYASHINAPQLTAMCIIAAGAVVGLFSGRHRAVRLIVGICAALLLLASMGTRGIFGGPYAMIVQRVPESGLFRELYDLVGLAAIAYIVLLAGLPKRWRILNWILLIATITYASSWLTHPVAQYWVPLNSVPAAKVSAAPNTRFAMVPPYQPIQFEGRGSGVDPDAYSRGDNVTPLNEYLAAYPVNVALSEYITRGRTSGLRALSVSQIIERPWFQVNFTALRSQGSRVPPVPRSSMLRLQQLSFAPEIVLQDDPAVAGLANQIGAGNIFFGDARAVSGLAPQAWKDLPKFLTVKAPNAAVNAANGWIDARFLFDATPSLGQGLGGAATTDTGVGLDIKSAASALINVNGRIATIGGKVISGNTTGYKWVPTPRASNRLECRGRCVVVGLSDVVPTFALNPPPRRYVSTAFSVLTPWLVRVHVPARSLPTLRYNVAYDPNWQAFCPGHPTTHIRLDASVNGWLLARSNAPYELYLFHRASVIQMICEVFGLSWLLIVLFHRQAKYREQT